MLHARHRLATLMLGALIALGAAGVAVPALAGTGAAASEALGDCGGSSPHDAARPVHLPPRTDGPTVLEVGFEILDVTHVDVLHGRFHLRVRIDFSWCDPRLAKDALESGSDVLYVSGSNVTEKLESTWNANLSITNQIGQLLIARRQMQIRSDGWMHASAILEADLSVNLELTRFPFDEQVLLVQIEPFGWDRDSVVLEIDEERTGIVQHFELAEWKLGEVHARVGEVERTGTDRLFSQLEIEIPIARKSGFYVWKAILPLILIVALSWSVFWIRESAAGRIRICATVMLTIVAYQFATAADLPKLPYMTLFTAFTTLSFVTVALAVVSIVVAFHKQESGGDPTAVERNDLRARWLAPTLYFAALALLGIGYLS